MLRVQQVPVIAFQANPTQSRRICRLNALLAVWVLAQEYLKCYVVVGIDSPYGDVSLDL